MGNVKNFAVPSEEFTQLVSECNASIERFISANPKQIKYETKEDGNTYITLSFGSVRFKKLKEIAELCRDTLNDAVFKIRNLPCQVFTQTETTITFKGSTTAMNEAIEEVKDVPALKNLITKAEKKIISIPDNLEETIETFVNNWILGTPSYEKEKEVELYDKYGNPTEVDPNEPTTITVVYSRNELANAGINFYEFNNRKHVNIAKDKLTASKVYTQSNILSDMVSGLSNLFNTNPKAINKLNENLNKKNIYIERCDRYMISLGYKISIPTTEPEDDFDMSYIQTPGKIARLVVHCGNATEYRAEVNSYDNTFIDRDGCERTSFGRYYFIASDEVSFVIPVEITEDSCFNDIENYLKNNPDFISEIGNREKYMGSWSMPEAFNVDNAFQFMNGVYLSSSDKKFTNGYHVTEDRLYDWENYTSNYVGDSLGMLCNRISENPFSSLTINDEVGSSSLSFLLINDGISIVKKAIEDGRALDICIPYPTGTKREFFESSKIEYVKNMINRQQ